jgi:HSP20 family molecular chaperone IbpA
MRQQEGETPEVLAQMYLENMGLWGESEPAWRKGFFRQRKMWRPLTDVYETESAVVVKVEIAGISRDDLTVSLSGRKLTIRGVRHDSAAKLGYQQMEIQYGYFETEVLVPRPIDEEHIEATYHEGFLSVRLPKAPARRVPVVEAEDLA